MIRFRYPNHSRFSRKDVTGLHDAAPLSVYEFFSYGSLVQSVVLEDVLHATDALTNEPLVFYSSTSDVVSASEVVIGNATTTVVDVGYAEEILAGRLASIESRSDTVNAADSILSHSIGAATDGVVFSDGLLSVVTAGFSDVLVCSDTSVAKISGSWALSDGVRATDSIGYGYVLSTSDSVVAGDSVAGNVVVSTTALLDTVSFSETLAGSIAVYAAVPSDIVVGSDVVIGALSLVGVLSDTPLFVDTISDAAYQVLVVVNADTGAVSTYTMTPVISGLVEYRGTLYLAGPDGLYAMDASEDVSGKVVWTLQTGFSNLGSDLLKRVRDVNVQGRTDGDLTAKAIVDRYGQKQEYHYLLPTLTRGAYRDGVIKIGKGLQSTYWAFGLQGEGPAEVDQLRIAVEPLSRRR